MCDMIPTAHLCPAGLEPLPASSAWWSRCKVVSAPARAFLARPQRRRRLSVTASATESKATEGEATSSAQDASSQPTEAPTTTEVLSKDIAKVVKQTATTFAPRASTKTKNPAVPGSTLYTVFEVQAYASMVLGGLLSYNLLFPSTDPDIWRLMGMWSVWMFTIPSLRARDCPDAEKTALNYLFLVVPLVNVTLPLVWKSFAAVWTADVITFFAFYAWKLEWLKTPQSGQK